MFFDHWFDTADEQMISTLSAGRVTWSHVQLIWSINSVPYRDTAVFTAQDIVVNASMDITLETFWPEISTLGQEETIPVFIMAGTNDQSDCNGADVIYGMTTDATGPALIRMLPYIPSRITCASICLEERCSGFQASQPRVKYHTQGKSAKYSMLHTMPVSQVLLQDTWKVSKHSVSNTWLVGQVLVVQEKQVSSVSTICQAN